MIQNLSNLTKMLPLRSLTMQGAVSIEITEIIWICNVIGFFFKFGKQICLTKKTLFMPGGKVQNG
jgi:hypothetical protein